MSSVDVPAYRWLCGRRAHHEQAQLAGKTALQTSHVGGEQLSTGLSARLSPTSLLHPALSIRGHQTWKVGKWERMSLLSSQWLRHSGLSWSPGLDIVLIPSHIRGVFIFGIAVGLIA